MREHSLPSPGQPRSVARTRRARASRTGRAALTALLTLGLLAPALTASALTPANDNKAKQRKLKEQIAAAAEQFQAASSAAQQAAARLASAEAKLPAARARLYSANARLSSARTADAAAARALAAAVRKDRQLQAELVRLIALIGDMESKVNALARRLYTQGGTFVEMEIVLNSKSPAEFTESLAAVNAVARTSNRTLEQMAEARADLQLAKAQAEAQRLVVEQRRVEAQQRVQEANEAQNEAEEAKAEVDKIVDEREAALAIANREKEKALRELNELRAEQQRLLAKAKASGNSYNASRPGTLLWPVTGASTSGQIGWRTHPVYGYRSCHTGIDLRAGSGTPIKAAADGLVVDISSGGAYGNRILISHGGGMTTMYAHLSRFGTREGAVVKQGQTIGYVGSTGYSTGPHLHWEVHLNGVPYNPMGWFGGSRSVISCYDDV